MDATSHDVIIIGAGMAGLTCARELHRRGRTPLVLEASAHVGGRVHTELVDGFRLDRGFQVLLTAYPEVRRELDVEALGLGTFSPGAVVRLADGFHRVADPLREPSAAVRTLMAPVGTLADKARVLAMAHDVRSGSVSELLRRPASTARTRLRDRGFTDRMVNEMLGPLYRGIFLERELQTSSRRLEFVMRMQASGDIGLPAGGMSAVGLQLADTLPLSAIRLNTRVESLTAGGVRCADGSELRADAVVIATDEHAAWGIAGGRRPQSGVEQQPGCTTVYYATDEPPHRTPTLVLNGEGLGVVDNAAVVSNVQPSYAPQGQSLIQATHIGIPDVDDATFEQLVRDQLTSWLGEPVRNWRHLATQRVERALPFHGPEADLTPRTVQVRDSTWVCGDHLGGGTLNGAMASGRAAGQEVAQHLAR